MDFLEPVSIISFFGNMEHEKCQTTIIHKITKEVFLEKKHLSEKKVSKWILIKDSTIKTSMIMNGWNLKIF